MMRRFCYLMSAMILGTGVSTSQPLLPTNEATYEVQTTMAIEYGVGEVMSPTPGEKVLLLDLYEPIGAAATGGLSPAVILIHGGGFVDGSRQEPTLVNIAQAMAARGYVAISIDYRLGPDVPIPSARVSPILVALAGDAPPEGVDLAKTAAIDDGLTAVDWLIANAGSLNIDPSQIGLVGTSAGAVNVVHLGYILNNYGVAAQPFTFVVDLWGGSTIPDDDRVAAANHLESGEPPLFVVHGTADTQVDFELSELLVARAAEQQVPYEFYPIQDGGHVINLFANTTEAGVTLFDQILNWTSAISRSDSAAAKRLINLSTNADIPSNGNMDAGFIIDGPIARRLIIYGENQEGMSNPVVEVIDFFTGEIVASNDDWQDHSNADEIATTLRPPQDERDAALAITVAPGTYLARLRNGDGAAIGRGNIQVNDVTLNDASPEFYQTQLINLSTNANIPANGQMDAGFILETDSSRRFIIYGENQGGMTNPVVEIFDFTTGALLDSNDDWQDHSSANEVATTLRPPQDEHDAALAITLPAGSYIARLRNSDGNGQGQGNIQVNDVTAIEVATGLFKRTLNHDGLAREYLIYIPASYTGAQAVSLLFSLHGATRTKEYQYDLSAFNLIADRENFILITPEATTLQRPTTLWNHNGHPDGADDIGFISALIDETLKDYNIDTDRIYAAGSSNGGFLSFQLACQLSDRIAAITAVKGGMNSTQINACRPTRSVPILQLHGTADQNVAYEEAVNSLDFWIGHNQTATAPVIIGIPDIAPDDGSVVEYYLYDNGINQSTVEHFKVIGGGHDWFGAEGNRDIDASAEAWLFFSQHDLNGRI